MNKRLFILAVAAVLAAAGVSAQSLFDEIILDGETVSASSDSIDIDEQPVVPVQPRRATAQTPKDGGVPSLWDLTDEYGNPLDSLYFGPQELLVDPYMDVEYTLMPPAFYMPATFISYDGTLMGKAVNPVSPDSPKVSEMNWADRVVARTARQQELFQQFMIAHPELVVYNIETLPRAPKDFVMEVDPTSAKINVTEFTRDVKEMASVAAPVELKRIHWLHKFDGSLQFSQAYISPNWYQGGKSNLNGLMSLFYKLRLNPAFHPNFSFELTTQYRVGVNNAPDDEVHNYNITEDLLQINMNTGLKAWKRWSYSANAVLKTQMLNHFRNNSHDLTSAMFAPGDFNLGIGMTYGYSKNKVNFSASINPLSYNLRMCLNHRLPPQWFGIEEGKKTKSQYGSNTELRFSVRMAWNIEYSTRLFAFTNYETAYGDWEHTLNFTINRYLSTRLYCYLRYQSDGKQFEDTKWHKWQLKEILSIGFSYTFARE